MDAPQRVASWRVWLDDGSTIEGATIDEFALVPDDGLLGMLLRYVGGGGRVCSGSDYYWAFPGLADTVYAHGNDNPADRYPGAIIKRGRWTDDITQAQVDADIFAEVERLHG